ncbi:MAG: FecR domain-containing protein [Deltaproteobacteria bacterium]|nr:FecR domain-containing protein [Deltaproteobacteria bacterium]
MTRIISRLIVLTAILILMPAVLFAAPIGKVVYLEGAADVTLTNGKIIPLRLSDPVNVGEVLRTKSGAKAEVVFTDGNTLWLAEKTRLRISQYQNVAGKKSFFDLFRGKARIVINALAGKSTFEIHTPTAICGVRGTIIIGYFSNGLSGFAFERGQGYGYNRRTPGQIVEIGTGQVMEVATASSRPVVRRATVNEINQHLEDTSATDARGQAPADKETVTSTPPEPTPRIPAATLWPTMQAQPALPTPPVSPPATEPPHEPEPVPAVSVETDIVSPTKEKAATFYLSSPSATGPVTFEYSLNGASWQAVAGNTLTLTDSSVMAGPNNILFRAKDPHGNVTDPDDYSGTSWTVYALDVVVNAVLPANSNTTVFTLNSNTTAVTFEYQINNSGQWIPVAGNTLELTAPAVVLGGNSILFRAKDLYGNVSDVIDQVSWTVSDLFKPVALDGSTGALSATLPGQTQGVIHLTAGQTAVPFLTGVSGTLFDGSIYNGFLAGMPGSWRGLFTAIYKKDSSIGLLSSTDLNDAAYSGGVLNASGTLARTAGYTASGAFRLFPDLPVLILENLAIGEGFSNSVINEAVWGYETSTGGILGIWGVLTEGGTYGNTTAENSKDIYLYHYRYSPPYMSAQDIDHFIYGNVAITDDLQGHTTVSGADSVYYLDRRHLGTLSLEYRGVYHTPQAEGGYLYDAIGTGVYKLAPLAWSGDWGAGVPDFSMLSSNSLYGHRYDPVSQVSNMEIIAHDMGLMGGLSPFWTGPSHFVAIGNLMAEDRITPVSGAGYLGPCLWNTSIDARSVAGNMLNGVYIPDADFTGVTGGIWKDGLMTGKAYAIYKTAAGQAGWLTGAVDGFYKNDNNIGMWKAEGDLTPTPSMIPLPEGVTQADLEVFHENTSQGALGGTFAGSQGTIRSNNNVMQAAFYGKGIYTHYEESGAYDLDKVVPLPWGIYSLMAAYNNYFSGKPAGATSWTAKVGGMGDNPWNGRFVYLADIAGTWAADETISGQLTGRYMTPLYAGELSGPFYGIYEEVSDSDIPNGSGGWIGQSVGAWQGQSLAFVSDIHIQAFNDDGYAEGNLDMLLGGVGSLWTGGDVQATGMGAFNGEGDLWLAHFYSNNFKNNTFTTYDAAPGAYFGFIGLSVDRLEKAGGDLIALYRDNAGRVGYLSGSLNGTADASLGLFEVDGLINRLDMAAAPAELTAANLYDRITDTGYRHFAFPENALEQITVSFLAESEAWITGMPAWGIWKYRAEGSIHREGDAWQPPASWSFNAAANENEIHWNRYDEVQWALDAATMSGHIAGAKVDWANATTALIGGGFKGAFNPVDATWKAIAQGAMMDAATFLAKIDAIKGDSAALLAFYKATGIPCFQVGATDLRGSGEVAGGVIDLGSANDASKGIFNATFFAPSTGAQPRVWASGTVSGSYSGAPEAGFVALTGYAPGTTGAGNGIAADFNIRQFGATWGAIIDGGAPANSLTAPQGGYAAHSAITFQGGAAGTVDAAAGTFTGTAAGIVH